MKILLLGASSYVGARLYNDLVSHHELLGTYFTHQFSDKLVRLNVTNQNAVIKVVQDFSPDWIIHTANNASASWCAQHPAKAQKLNHDATQYIVDAANTVKAKTVFISSYAAINTSELYGKLKKRSEDIVRQTHAGFLILRPSLVVGLSPNTKNDRTFNRILKGIIDKKSVLFDTSWKFQPTYIGHLSEIILKSMEQDKSRDPFNSIFHVAIDAIKSQYDIACDIMRPFNIKPEPVDMKLPIATVKKDLSPLKKIGLSFYDYESMIEIIAKEIKQYKMKE